MKNRIGITGKKLGFGGDLLTVEELAREANYESSVKNAAFDLLAACKAAEKALRGAVYSTERMHTIAANRLTAVIAKVEGKHEHL